VLGGRASLLEAARAGLDPVIPRALLPAGAERARSLASSLEGAVAAAGGMGVDAATREWFTTAAGENRLLGGDFAAWLEAERLPGAGDAVALGRGGLEEWLRRGEALGRSAEEVAASGAARLEEDAEALAAGCGRACPGLDTAAAWRRAPPRPAC